MLCFSLGALPALAQFVPNRYTVLLEDPPVSSRFARREEMQNAAAVAYRQQVERRQAAIIQDLRSRNIQVTGSESLLINAVYVTATPDRVAEIASVPGVLAVRPMRWFKPVMNKAVQQMNATAAWNALGGQTNAGKGIKIAVLDSGIDQNHPAFQDSTLSVPAGFPKCTDGHPEDCAYTNSKVIVARSYVRMLAMEIVTDPNNPAPASVPDDYSPRDRVGHGTAVASAAAGNINTGTVTFSGMAPKAWLGNYKIAGSPYVNDGAADDVLIQAIKDALTDGMDIASLSYGSIALSGPLDTGTVCGNPAGAACDPVAAAYEAAAKAGLIIAVAAGNDGNTAYFNGGQYPYYDSMSSPATAPSVISVGAITNSHVLTSTVSVSAADAPSSLKGMAAEPTDAVFFPSTFGANSGPLVDVSTLGNDGLACTALPAYSLYNSIALIERGTCTFATKATNAMAAGAIGIVFYMADSSTPIAASGLNCSTGACFYGPGVMISNSAGTALKSYLASHAGANVAIDLAGAESDVASFVTKYGLSPAGVNQLASFSSLGPTPDGSIKPDLVAVGGFDGDLGIPSAGLYMAAQKFDPLGILYSSNGYAAADGTSFATPITAGAAALVKQAHPGWTAAQIKSALVNSAAQDVTVDDFGDTVDVRWVGGGRLDAGAAVASSVTAEPATVSFGFVKTGSLPIAKTITVTNNGSASVTLAAAAAATAGAVGATVAVSPQTLTIAAGQQATLTVTLSGTVPSPGAYSGAVTLSASGVSVRLPYLFLVGDGVPYNANPISSFAFGTPGTDGGALFVQVTDQYGVPVSGSAVVFSVSPRGFLTLKSIPGAPACSPASATTSVTCNTDSYGIAYVDAVLGSTAGSATITAKTLAGSFSLTAVSQAAPQLKTSGGAVNAASFQNTAAPGSYISLFGNNLVDSSMLFNASGDAATAEVSPNCAPASCLPISIDYTNVSFDVPSAGISVPGYLSFGGTGQVNVLVPWELEGQSSVQMKVISDGLAGNVLTVPLSDYAPAFFGSGIVAAVNATAGNVVTASTPVKAGDVLELFANGLGPVTNQPASGFPAQSSPLSQTKSTPVVTIGGKQAAVSFSGLAPGYVGLYQINVTVPSGLSSGNQQTTVAIGGQTSPAVNLPLQ